MISEEYSLRCHEMAKELMREFRIVEQVARRYRDTEDRIRDYAKYYQRAYHLFYTLGTREAGE